jgi:hypothetical protein
MTLLKPKFGRSAESEGEERYSMPWSEYRRLVSGVTLCTKLRRTSDPIG